MKLSVIIPTFDAAHWIDPCLRSVRKDFKGELIVVDGGSQDGTTAKAMAYRANIYRSPHNFAEQCNEGAREAMGDVLLFLSSQVEVLPGWMDAIEQAMKSEYVSGGGLRAVWDGESFSARALSFGQDFGSRCLDVALSPQGIFARRDLFLEFGGFSSSAILPHLWLAERLKERGEFVYLDAPLRVMSKPWEAGWVNTLGQYLRAYRAHRRQEFTHS